MHEKEEIRIENDVEKNCCLQLTKTDLSLHVVDGIRRLTQKDMSLHNVLVGEIRFHFASI